MSDDNDNDNNIYDNVNRSKQQKQKQKQKIPLAKDESSTTDNNNINKLMTKKALEISLSPPRVPPFDSVHRAVYLGHYNDKKKNLEDIHHNNNWYTHYHVHGEIAHSIIPHETFKQRLRQQLYVLRKSKNKHPHLAEESTDKITRLLATWFSTKTSHKLRDNGWFRSISDTIVTLSLPIFAITNPYATKTFIQLSNNVQIIQYGTNNTKRQYVELYRPQNDNIHIKRLIYFVHGGAWGSGHPWMYRLIVEPYIKQGWAVAIPSYRTYPDGICQDQVDDIENAYNALPNNIRSLPTVCMGHSSGAHICLLLLINRIINKQDLTPIDSFIGLSGPYDISYHFDYEAGRGVEELSPMKPVNGNTRTNFRINSPCIRLQDSLVHIKKECGFDTIPLSITLIHGIEDETVPFTSTSDAARILRSCGIKHINEIYLPETGHQDCIIQIMLGGYAQTETIKYIKQLDGDDDDDNNNSNNSSQTKSNDTENINHQINVPSIRSKL